MADIIQPGRGSWNNFRFAKTYSELLVQAGYEYRGVKGTLVLPTYANEPGSTLSYRTGAIVSLVSGTTTLEVRNYDPNELTDTPFGVILDDRLPVSDSSGNIIENGQTVGTVAGLSVFVVTWNVVLQANGLFAYLPDLSDVNTAMTAVGARYLPAENYYKL